MSGLPDIPPEEFEAHRLIEDKFGHYRAAGIALSLTLITLASGLIVWANTRLEPSRFVQVLSLVMVACIGACVFLQFSHYMGTRHEARAHLGQSNFKAATWWFDREDVAVYLSIALFVVGVCLAAGRYFCTC